MKRSVFSPSGSNHPFARVAFASLTLLLVLAQLFVLPAKTTFAADQRTKTGISVYVHVPSDNPIIGRDAGTAIAGADVTVLPYNLRATTDAQGMVVFAELPIKSHVSMLSIRVNAPGYRPWLLRDDVIVAGAITKFNAPLTATKNGAAAGEEVIDAPKPRWITGEAQTDDTVIESNGRVLKPGQIRALYFSNTVAPATIRVRRVSLGVTQVVDFYYYIKHVLPSEWIPSWDTDALNAGAMAVKSYSWYRVNVAKYPNLGYDVKDTTSDQVYNPNKEDPRTNTAGEFARPWRMARNGAIFEAQYCSGSSNGSQTSGQCTQLFPSAGFTVGNFLSQNGSQYKASVQGFLWDALLRFYYNGITLTKDDSGGGTGGGTGGDRTWPVLRNGSTGEAVKSLQYMLRARGFTSITVDGQFGPATETAVKSFQGTKGLAQDGVVGNNTWEAVIISSMSGDNGEQVKALQAQLNRRGNSLTVDGAFGPATDTALRSYQSANGLISDGVAGLNTWCKLVGGTLS